VKTVLLLYHDLGFAFWLGQTLDRVGYQTFPARNVSDARFLVERLGLSLDLVIFNPDASGSVAYIEEQQNFNPNLKTIIVIEDNVDFPVVSADGYRRKPAATDDLAGAEWIQFVGLVLAGRREEMFRRELSM
jgi:hypothetical protein